MQAISFQLPVSKLTIHGLTTTHAKDPIPTLALHGWLDNCHSFIPLQEHLRDRWLICIDLPGHGQSDHIAAGLDLHFRDYLLWIREILERQGWSSIKLLGHSMGAAIASLFAGCFPDLVTELILIEGIGPLSGSAEELPKRTREHIESFLKIADRRNPSYESFEQLVALRRRSGQLSEKAARLLAERGTIQDTVAGLRWRHDSRLKVPSALNFSEEQTLAFLANIQCPSLIIQASLGLLKRGEPFASRLEAMKQIERYDIEGGHHVHMEKPQEIAQAIHDFELSYRLQASF